MTTPVQTYARAAAVLLLLSVLAGSFGEFYVPNKIIVWSDVTATVNNFIAYDSLFRLGFASYLVEAMCDISLALIFYVLLRPVGRNLSLLAAFFGLVSTATFAVAELFYFAASHIAGGADYLKTFSPDQVNALALLSLKVSGYCAGLFMVFYGVASILRGYLIVRSGYLPKFLGALLALGGVGFVTRSFALVLAPAYASSFLLLPMIVAMLALMLWLFARGIDLSVWKEKAATAA
ncbi:MAG: DUF4386 domain-containing protein [Gammaproteobacteria bacterium]|nr:DUF4386 domain-containing protein [Gammaproteobacteria bacterium]